MTRIPLTHEQALTWSRIRSIMVDYNQDPMLYSHNEKIIYDGIPLSEYQLVFQLLLMHDYPDLHIRCDSEEIATVIKLSLP